MDLRTERTRAALQAAAIELTRAQPIAAVSVAALCRAAGITRDTFYRHAASPAALLAEALQAELVEVIGALGGPDGRMRPETGGFRAATTALLEHVAEHETVYRHALRPDAASEVRAMLVGFLHDALVAHARADALATDELPLEIAAAYAAAGTVGAIEAWLRAEPLDVERGVAHILAASSDFWLDSTGESHLL